jgi:hypothetical protein
MTEEDGVTWLVRWAHLALKEDLPFSHKKRAAQNLAAVDYKPITVTKSIGYYRLLF